MPEDSGFTIRAATEGDVPQLMGLIWDLAVYEKLTHEVVATEASLRASLFGDVAGGGGFAGVCGSGAGGICRVLPHVFHVPGDGGGCTCTTCTCRRSIDAAGLGTQLLRRVAAIAVERDCGRFEWVALDWNTDAHRFYEDLGAEMLPEWRTFRVVGDSLRRLAEGGRVGTE